VVGSVVMTIVPPREPREKTATFLTDVFMFLPLSGPRRARPSEWFTRAIGSAPSEREERLPAA
jgi:hypothetical protein